MRDERRARRRKKLRSRGQHPFNFAKTGQTEYLLNRPQTNLAVPQGHPENKSACELQQPAPLADTLRIYK